MGKKSSPAPAPIILPPAPQPQIVHFAMPPMPAMPEIPQPPAPTYIPPDDYREEELQAENERKLNARNRLRAGRASTIKTSPMGLQEDVDIKKVQLLGG